MHSEHKHIERGRSDGDRGRWRGDCSAFPRSSAVVVARHVRTREPRRLRPDVDAGVGWPGLTPAGEFTVRGELVADALILWLSGTLDGATSALLARELDAQSARAPRLVVDLTGLEFIDASGLGVLARAARLGSERGRQLSFRRGPDVAQAPFVLIHNVHPRPRSAGQPRGS
jgi:anti-anti-sigma factor